MDLTSALGALNTDYVSKVTAAMKESVAVGTNANKVNGTDSFDSIFNAVSDMVSRQRLIFLLAK